MATTYIATDAAGKIQMSSAADFPATMKAAYPQYTFASTTEDVEYGYDGGLYVSSALPADPDATEKAYLAERAVVFDTYERPYDGTSGGVLNLVRMMHAAALMEVPQDAAKLDSLSSRYQVELANMRAEYDTIDDKYGV